MKYNKLSQLGILNGDRLCLIEVTYIRGLLFGNLIRVHLIEGDRLIEDRLFDQICQQPGRNSSEVHVIGAYKLIY